MAKGHSNLRLEQIYFQAEDKDKALIPQDGGETLAKVRALPPLALTRAEYQTIGQVMKWDERFDKYLSMQSLDLLKKIARLGIYGQTAEEVGARLIDQSLQRLLETKVIT